MHSKVLSVRGLQQPKIGGEVVPHQDSSFLATSPPSATGLWLALEPATVDNGCLWTLPAPPVDHVARHFLRRCAHWHRRDRPGFRLMLQRPQDFADLATEVRFEVVWGKQAEGDVAEKVGSPERSSGNVARQSMESCKTGCVEYPARLTCSVWPVCNGYLWLNPVPSSQLSAKTPAVETQPQSNGI